MVNRISPGLFAWFLAAAAGGLYPQGYRLGATEHVPQVEIQLLSDQDHVAAGDKFRLGLLFKIAPGCHIYWKNPGDAGLAPEVDWDLPSGFVAGPLFWPAPTRLEEPGGLFVNTYADEVLLFSWVQPPPELNVSGVVLKARASWLVCRKICVQEKAEARLSLAVGPGPSAPGNGLEKFRYYAARVPRSAREFPSLRVRAGWDETVAGTQDTRIGLVILESLEKGTRFLTGADQLEWFDMPSDILGTEDYHLDAANSRPDRVVLHLRVKKLAENSAWPSDWGGVLNARLVDEHSDTLNYSLSVDLGD